MFSRSVAKLTIGSLDNPNLAVEAHYNPKELGYARTVPWAAHPLANKKDENQMEVEFTGAQPRTMELEMLFDAFESSDSIAEQIDALDLMAAPDDKLRRPHYCIVTWGNAGVRPLRCVIESLNVKYTVLDPMGTPKRALCNVKIREAHLQDDFDAAERSQLAAMRQRMASRTQ